MATERRPPFETTPPMGATKWLRARMEWDNDSTPPTDLSWNEIAIGRHGVVVAGSNWPFTDLKCAADSLRLAADILEQNGADGAGAFRAVFA